MEIIIGLVILAGIVWYIYKKVGVAADVNNDGKVNSEDAKVAVDMAVTSVGGFATGAAVAAANAVEEKIDKAREEVKTNIDAKTEEIFVKVMEEAAKVEKPVEEILKEVVATVEPVVEEIKKVETAVVEEAKEAAAELVKEVDKVIEEVKTAAKRGRKKKVK